ADAPKKEEPKYPIVKPSGVIYTHWGMDLAEDADGYNEFAMDRVYVRADAQVSKNVSTRVTLDADRLKPVEVAEDTEVTVDTKYRVFVKHAYVEFKEFGVPGVKIRAGMVDTPYTPFYDNFWGNRYITESFAKSQKILETADLGFAVVGSHAKGLVDWNVSVLNGGGYAKLESDAGKSVQAKVTVDPLAPGKELKLPITAFVNYDTNATDEVSTLTWVGAAGFAHDYAVLWAEILGTSSDGVSGLGYSATVNPKIPKVAGLVLRYDHFDPDGDTDDDGNTVLIAGLTHDFWERVSVAATFEQTATEAEPDAPSQGIFLRGQAGF
ncbi:MAG: hypothetical protein ABMB14_35495, partial [Myxococcota bacterium]